MKMKSEFQKISGIILIAAGIVLVLNSSPGITGFIISEFISRGASSALGLVFIVGGILLFLRGKESNLALEVKKSGAILTNPKKLIKIAGKMGYQGRMINEGYQVLDEKRKPLTVIPSRISKGVFYDIIDALSTGMPNFRKRTGYSTG